MPHLRLHVVTAQRKLQELLATRYGLLEIFPVGIGNAGCLCGAVSGGVMALGLVFGRTTPKDSKVDKAMKLSRELHDIFKKRHKHLCCRTLNKYMIMGSSRQMKQCIAFTGEMAQETARIIIREQEK